MTDQTMILRHFKQVDSVIYKVMKDLAFDTWLEEYEREWSTQDYFEKLCRNIVGQQLSGKAARTIHGRFVDLFEGNTITPARVLAVEDTLLRGAGLSWAKVKYVKDLATKVASNELVLEALPDLSDEEVIEALLVVKGVGRWTAEMFLMFTLRREDVFSFGDLGLKRGVEKVYGVTEPTDEEITAIISPWSPYKTYGSIALWHALE